MKKAKRIKVKDPILGFLFYVQYGGTEYEAYKWFEKMTGCRVPSTVHQGHELHAGSFGANSSMPYVGVIWISEKAGGSTIVHECGHATTNVCRVLEMNPVNSDEFYSSYLGWLFREVNIFIQGKTK